MEDHFSIAEVATELRMTEAAVLRACLDEQLDLSIRFSGRNLPHAKLRRQLPMEPGYSPKRVKTAPLGLYDMTFTLGADRSLWTLVMAGSGRLCVEDEYQKAIGRVPAVSESSPSSRLGVFVSTPDDSVSEPGYVMLYELVEYRGTAPADAIRFDEDFHCLRALPAGSELVVSKAALTAFRTKRSTETAAGHLSAASEPDVFTPIAESAESLSDGARRMVAWKKAMKKQWPRMLADFNGIEPSSSEVLAWYKANDEEAVFRTGGGDRDFKWVGADNKTRETSLKTFQNAISEMKSNGEIPA